MTNEPKPNKTAKQMALPLTFAEEFIRSATGTEILAMGIQRFFEAPIKFMQDDSEYYEFVKSILLKK